MKILVNGIGNIGTTLLDLLAQYKDLLAIEEIYALKNNAQAWHKDDLKALEERGILICTRIQGDGYLDFETVRKDISYVFDCTNNGGGLRNKSMYDEMPSLIGACAQGSEKNFGISFMSGVNNEVLGGQRYAHIVSCNTHSIAALLSTFSGHRLEALEAADFVIVRRSEDLGNHQRLVSANVVARHLDPHLGTHHSIDVLDLYKTVGIEFPVTSSDVTTPSQLMHGVRFNIRLKTIPDQDMVEECIAANPYLASSTKFDSNVIFERGRRWGHHGRMYNHAIVISNNLLFLGHQIMGWAFIPQEGNTLLSTLHAFLLQVQHPKEAEVMQTLQRELLRKEW